MSMRNVANPENEALTHFGERTQRFQVRPHALAIYPRFHCTSMNQLYDAIEAQQTLCRTLTATSSLDTAPTSRHGSLTTNPDSERL